MMFAKLGSCEKFYSFSQKGTGFSVIVRVSVKI